MSKTLFRRNILVIFVLTTALLLFAWSFSETGEDSTPTATPTPTEVLHVECSPGFPVNRDLIFRFSLPMVEPNKPETAERLEITFGPERPGVWTWRSPTELVFSPDREDLRQKCDYSFTISINKAIPLAGEAFALQEPFHRDIRVLCPRPVPISAQLPTTAGEDIVFNFGFPMVKPEELETAAYPEVSFKPEQKGTFAWRSPTQLVFSPAEGSLGWGQRVTMTIPEAVPLLGEEWGVKLPWHTVFTIPKLEIAGKQVNWPIIPGQPHVVNFLNWHTEQVGRGPIFLLYDQPVDIEKVATVLKITDEAGNLLEREVYRPQDVTQVFDGEIDLSFVAAVRIIDLPSYGQSVIFHIPNWTNPEQPELLMQSLAVNTKFHLLNYSMQPSRGDGRASLETSWDLVFNNSFQLDRFEQSLHIIPQPDSLSVRTYWSDRVTIRLTLRPGTQYQLGIGRQFTDIFGNPLADPIEFSFKSQDLPPVLQVPETPALLEHGVKRLPIRVRNVESVEAKVFRFSSPWNFGMAIEAGHKYSAKEYGLEVASETINIPLKEIQPNVTTTFDVPFDVSPGLMCVEVRAFGTGSEAEGVLRDAILVQSTDLGLTTKIFENSVFAWVTRLHSAEPVEGARIALYAEGKMVSEGLTDESGVVSLAAKDIATGTGLKKTAVLVAEKFGYTAVSRLVDDELSFPWQFGLKGKVEGAGVLPAAVFTERGVYRPGEVVHLKVIVSRASDIQGTEVDLHIQDPRGQQLFKQHVELDQFGSADLDIPLKEEAVVGEYLIQVSIGENMTIRKFRVEEYRVPTFQVSVTSEQEVWQYGEENSAVIRAEYLHGGTLDGRPARWEISRQPVSFASSNFPGYVFNLGDASSLAGSVAAEEIPLDGQGQTVIAVKPDHPSSAGPMRYIVEATVTDVDRQAYAGRLSRVVHPTSFYLGLLPPPRQVMDAGETLNVPVIAVQPDGTPLEGIPLRVQLERLDYHTSTRMSHEGIVQMLNRAVPVEQQHCEITSQKTAVNCAFEFPKAGFYLIRASAQDANFQAVQAGFTLTASGDVPTAWPRFDQDRIDVIADQPEYRIGDVARLVVQTPYKRAQGLLTVERDGVLSYHTFEIRDDTPALEVPITAEYAPNVFVSVILLRGRMHHEKDASGFETGAPGFKIGYAKLKVAPEDRRLDIQVTPSNIVANPGQNMKVDLLVRDHKGRPVSGQATVMVVDEAVLGLTGYRTPDPLSQIYVERFLGVRTGASILDLPHARRLRREKVFPSGDQDQGDMFFHDPAVLRKLFMSTAYWNPKIPVGKDGKASVEFTLPDNLTTFRIMAIVTDESSRVGADDKQVLVRKPLMVQPVLPRFLYPNDTLQVEALVFNGTESEGEITVKGEFEGIDSGEGFVPQPLIVRPGASASFTFPATVVGKEKALIRFGAGLGEYTDAVEITLPILSPGNQRNIVVSKSIAQEGMLAITLPAERIPESEQIEVVTSTTALSELKDSVQYLMRYPNGCIEQTTSTAYPLVVLKDLLPEIGVEVDQADLKKFSEAGVKRILSFQTPSGGLSYWPGSPEPHAFATAFGLTALIEAKKRGYDVPDAALAGMADYLEASLKKGDITENIPHGGMADGDTRALFVMTLGRLGRPQPGYISVLWRNKEQLTAFGLSFLAIAVREMASEHALLKSILAEIRKAAQEEDKEAYYTGKPKGGWSLDSPLRTHGSALIAFAEAGGDDEGMTGKLLTGLLKRRQGGLWGNTQENVFGIMGVYTAAGRKVGGDAPRMTLKIEDREVSEEEMEHVSERVRRLTLMASDLALQPDRDETRTISMKNNGGAPIILTVRAKYDVPLNEKNRQAQSKGFTLTRHYETLEGKSLEGQPIPLGSLIRVRLRMTTDDTHHYVAIDDKLPAGLEPLNTNLETTEKVSMGEFSNEIQRSLSVLSYQETRDSRVAFYVDEMLPGVYEYVYIARATTPGTFLRPAGRVEAMYQPDIFGTTSIDEVTVQEK